LADFGGELIATVHSYCEKHGLSMDNEGGTTDCGRQPRPRSAARQRAFTMFGQGASVEDVAAELGRAESTVNCYLSEYIEAEKPSTIEYWVDAAACSRIEAVCKQAKDGRLKPIFEALGGDVPYSTIRLVMAHLKADTIDA
jgi:ATP-dependent DNA helicase RecQ